MKQDQNFNILEYIKKEHVKLQSLIDEIDQGFHDQTSLFNKFKRQFTLYASAEKQTFYDYMEKFGFDTKTNKDLQAKIETILEDSTTPHNGKDDWEHYFEQLKELVDQYIQKENDLLRQGYSYLTKNDQAQLKDEMKHQKQFARDTSAIEEY